MQIWQEGWLDFRDRSVEIGNDYLFIKPFGLQALVCGTLRTNMSLTVFMKLSRRISIVILEEVTRGSVTKKQS